MITLFTQFRKDVKAMLRSEHMSYRQLSEKIGISESAIKCFMCGESDSSRTAEYIADALNFDFIYSNGSYTIIKRK